MKNNVWEGYFGDEYVKRNEFTDSDLKNREVFWRRIAQALQFGGEHEDIENVYEFGCGQGINIVALDNVSIKKLNFHVTEINKNATKELKKNIRGVKIYEDIPSNIAEVAITSGVLIHIDPDMLLDTMKKIYYSTSAYIICSEYFSPDCRMIPYRGKDNILWSNDFGKIWVNNFNLRVVDCFFNWKVTTGLDNTTTWVLEKVN